ncbi:MAG TPA: hypothetical protein VGQ83_01510 [Polyangia bacterium]
MLPPKAGLFLLGFAVVTAGACASSEARGSDDNYAVAIEAPKESKIGQAAKTVLRLTPKGKYHVNTKYPIAVTITPPAGVDVPKARLKAGDGQISEQEARFEVGFTPRDAGQKVFTAELKFSVCTDQNCDIKKEKITWTTTAR